MDDGDGYPGAGTGSVQLMHFLNVWPWAASGREEGRGRRHHMEKQVQGGPAGALCGLCVEGPEDPGLDSGGDREVPQALGQRGGGR